VGTPSVKGLMREIANFGSVNWNTFTESNDSGVAFLARLVLFFATCFPFGGCA